MTVVRATALGLAAASTVALLAACGPTHASAGPSLSPTATARSSVAAPSSSVPRAAAPSTAAPAQSTSSPSSDPSTPRSSGSPVAAPPATPAGRVRAATSIFVTYSGWSGPHRAAEAAGYAGVVQADGTCTFVLQRGATRVTTEGTAWPSATTTSCPDLSIAADRLTAGTWTGRLTYESPTASATSGPFTIEVP